MLKVLARKVKISVLNLALRHRVIDNHELGETEDHSEIFCFERAPSQEASPSISDMEGNRYDSRSTLVFSNSKMVVFENVEITSRYGFAYTEKGKFVCAPNRPWRVMLRCFPIKTIFKKNSSTPPEKVHSAFYMLGFGAKNFYHWTHDFVSTLPEYFAFKEVLAKQNSTERFHVLCPANLPTIYYEMLTTAGVNKNDILEYSGKNLIVNKLAVPSSNKPINNERAHCKKRIQWLKHHLPNPETLTDKDAQTSETIFIKRPLGDQRIINYQELESFAVEMGFAIIDMTDRGYQDQVATFRGAREILCVHGAGLTNIIHCNPGTLIVEVLPNNFPALYYTNLSRICNLHHVLISAEKVTNKSAKLDMNKFRELYLALKDEKRL